MRGRALVVVVALASVGLASAASTERQHQGLAPLATEAAPVRSEPISRQTLLGAANELRAKLRAKAVSLVGWMQAPKDEAARQANEAKEVAREGAESGLSGYFLLSGWEIVINIVVGLLLLIIFGYLYKEYKYNYMMDAGWDDNLGEANTLDKDWKYPLLGCFETPKMCCIACCCPAIRWADSQDMTYQMSFWAAVGMWWLLSLCNMYVGFLFGILSGVLGAIYRQKIRKIFDIENNTPQTIALDFFAYCCCPCLPIVQEGRVLEAARKLKHEGVHDGVMETP